jgi:hypothetical protein
MGFCRVLALTWPLGRIEEFSRENNHVACCQAHQGLVSLRRRQEQPRSKRGEPFAAGSGMSRMSIDRRPGTRPQIKAEKDGSITYVVSLPGNKETRLVIRCDDAGELWVSIQPAQ